MKNILKSSFFDYFINIIKALMFISAIGTFIVTLNIGFVKGSWGVSEFLVNYEGGFIKRGLLGHILFIINQNFNISVYNTIVGFCIISFILLFLFLAYHFKKDKISIYFLFVSFLLGGPLISYFLIRKDCFLILCFILMVKVSLSKKKSFFLKSIIINLIGIFAILNHESFIFYGVLPIFLIFTFNEKIESVNIFIKKSINTILLLSPIIVSELITIFYKSNINATNIIWDSWDNTFFPYLSPEGQRGSIYAINWHPIKAINEGLSMFKGFSYGIYKPVGILFNVIITILFSLKIVENSKKKNNKISNQKILLFYILIQASGTILLFIVGSDYGRWIFFWIVSSYISYFLIPNRIVDNFMSFFNFNYLKNLRRNSLNLIKKCDINILFLLSGVCMYSWGLGYYIVTTPIGMIANFISYILGGFSTIITP